MRVCKLTTHNPYDGIGKHNIAVQIFATFQEIPSENISVSLPHSPHEYVGWQRCVFCGGLDISRNSQETSFQSIDS